MSQVITIRIEVPDGAVVTVDTASSAHLTSELVPPSVDIDGTPASPPTPAPAGFEVYDRRRNRLGPTMRALLEALATRHGRISEPTGKATARLVEIANLDSVNACAQALRKLDEHGHIDRHIQGKRCYRITLTASGWEAIGRTPPKAEDIDTSPAPRAQPERPQMPDAGPIERRPFDPQAIRDQQADAEAAML